MPGIPLCFAILSAWSVNGQADKGDWDAYVMRQEGGKPVSTVVDLSLAEKAPMRDKGYAILVRTALINPDADGMPSMQESEGLHLIEDQMEKSMAGAFGAVYAGRFTHRGIREFVFFAGDTSAYRKTLESVFTASPGHSWRARAMADTGWSNFFDVLYPPPRELERIRNRRLVDILSEKEDALKTSRRVDHFLRFRTKTAREVFLRALSREGFAIGSIPETDKDPTFPHTLHLFRNEVPGYPFVDRTVIPLWERAIQGYGRYEGWETYVVKTP